MTKERKTAEKETVNIFDVIRKVEGADAILIAAAMSYAQGLVEGRRIALEQKDTA